MAPPAVLPTRKLGKDGPEIPTLGLGLMSLSGSYGAQPPDEERFALLDRAWELGYTNWDSSDLYGDSEDLLGRWFKLHPERRSDIFLATKFGLKAQRKDGKVSMTVNSTPENARERCEASLKRLNTDYIDLYYVHRVDGKTPIEKTMEELVKLKSEGKIRHLGLSATSSATLRRASAVSHVAAMQVEYSLFSLDIEGPESTDLLKTCRELGVSTFAYSPVGRGFLSGELKSPDDFPDGDFRRFIPRFSAENFPKNLALVDRVRDLAAAKDATASQLALAWLLAQGDDIIPIPGTKRIKYIEENVAALKVELSQEETATLRKLTEGVAGAKLHTGIGIEEFGNTPEL